MKKQIIVTLCAGLWLPIMAAAQDSDLPALPDLPSTGGGSMNPLNPTVGDFPTIDPIEPLENEQPTSADNAQDVPDLPSLDNQEDFEFFQPGSSLGEAPLPPLEEESEPEETIVEEQPVRPARNPHERPYRKSFNYRQQRMPDTIYHKHYDRANRHLPVAQYEADYDRVTFAAAARNDVNGLRAMLEHGGRSKQMQNAYGETLVEVATRYQAHATLRYLLAIGAPRGNVQANDGLSHYALEAGRVQ